MKTLKLTSIGVTAVLFSVIISELGYRMVLKAMLEINHWDTDPLVAWGVVAFFLRPSFAGLLASTGFLLVNFATTRKIKLPDPQIFGLVLLIGFVSAVCSVLYVSLEAFWLNRLWP